MAGRYSGVDAGDTADGTVDLPRVSMEVENEGMKYQRDDTNELIGRMLKNINCI